MTLIQEVKGYVGQKVNGVSFNIDIVGFCSLFCPTCGIGAIKTKRHPGEFMPLSLWKQILDKADHETKIRKIQMYAYSDACLHPDLHLFLDYANQKNAPTLLSTMLQQTRCDFSNVIESRPSEFRISFPGLNKMEYYQAGAKKERFVKKFAEVTKLPRHKETLWVLVFHLYKDNEDEIPMARKLAEDNGMMLVIIPAIFMPCEVVVEKNYTDEHLDTISHLIETPEESIARMKKSNYCSLWKQCTLDVRGDIFLCQILYEERFKLRDNGKVMNFLDYDLKFIQSKIKNHTFCGNCIKAGGNVYQNCFADFRFTKTPIEDANKLRHKTWEKEPTLH